jgi:hypothetical protein
MKRKSATVAGAAVAIALLSLAGVLFHLSGDREAAESEAGERGPTIAEREDAAGPSAEDRAAGDEHREVRGAPGGEPQGPPGDPAEFKDWMKSQEWADFAAWAADSLRTQFGGTISETVNQLSLLELRQFLKENFPEDWDTKLDDLLRRAFPDDADQILAIFRKMDRYDEWLDDRKFDLAAMQNEEIRDALWEKREEIFGEEAAQEIWASNSESRHLRDLMEILEEADDIPLDDRIQLFRSAVAESDPGGADPLLQDRNHVMASAFLNMESVQDELRQMGPDERAETLRHIRQSMGIDEEAIEELEKVDEERERRWQNGLRYMDERDDLARDYDGAALDEELRFLRERYFGDEAKTIEAEEASGFFRYRRERIYGRN